MFIDYLHMRPVIGQQFLILSFSPWLFISWGVYFIPILTQETGNFVQHKKGLVRPN